MDRLAEVMARKKHDRAGKDVCATGILEYKDHATIFLAKNGRMRKRDLIICKQLQTWLRITATLGERRSIEKDIMWQTLVEWSKLRLNLYRSELSKLFRGAQFKWPASDQIINIQQKLQAVQDFSVLETEASIKAWAEVVNTCYELRYERCLLSYLEDYCRQLEVPAKAKHIFKYVAFMGRLRAA